MQPDTLSRRLERYVAGWTAPFDWARANCCHFADGWVREVEGRSVMPALVMTNARATWRLIHHYGGMGQAVTQHLGRASVGAGSAGVGDLVLMPCAAWGGEAGRYSLGICGGRMAWFIDERGAMLCWPTIEAAAAWPLHEAAAPAVPAAAKYAGL